MGAGDREGPGAVGCDTDPQVLVERWQSMAAGASELRRFYVCMTLAERLGARGSRRPPRGRQARRSHARLRRRPRRRRHVRHHSRLQLRKPQGQVRPRERSHRQTQQKPRCHHRARPVPSIEALARNSPTSFFSSTPLTSPSSGVARNGSPDPSLPSGISSRRDRRQRRPTPVSRARPQRRRMIAPGHSSREVAPREHPPKATAPGIDRRCSA